MNAVHAEIALLWTYKNARNAIDFTMEQEKLEIYNRWTLCTLDSCAFTKQYIHIACGNYHLLQDDIIPYLTAKQIWNRTRSINDIALVFNYRLKRRKSNHIHNSIAQFICFDLVNVFSGKHTQVSCNSQSNFMTLILVD